jgi:hypothetical protein
MLLSLESATFSTCRESVMSTLSGSANAGSESGLKVRLYAISNAAAAVLMQSNYDRVEQEQER